MEIVLEDPRRPIERRGMLGEDLRDRRRDIRPGRCVGEQPRELSVTLLRAIAQQLRQVGSYRTSDVDQGFVHLQEWFGR